jgi:hypothetical protein
MALMYRLILLKVSIVYTFTIKILTVSRLMSLKASLPILLKCSASYIFTTKILTMRRLGSLQKCRPLRLK